MFRMLVSLAIGLHIQAGLASSLELPGKAWTRRDPSAFGLDAAKLQQVARHLDGSGVIVKNGQKIHTWGYYDRPQDVASACKPLFSHFLVHAVETGKLPGFDALVAKHEPRLRQLNPELSGKDAQMTFRHMANQISCYGVSERPGTAFNYNDFQMSLFADTLFGRVLGLSYDRVDSELLDPHLGSVLQFQDEVTLFDPDDPERNGRLVISPRDFCRFGLLYLNRGRWGDRQILQPHHIEMVTSDPVPLSIPRTAARPADMIPGQRSFGSSRVPDDHYDHMGSYSWAWWLNGLRANGTRLWPDAPECTYAALGHKHGKRGLAVVPAWNMVFSWTDTRLDRQPWPSQASDPHPLNEVFRLLRMAGEVGD